MKTPRRQFLKRGALFVPCAFTIMKARAQNILSNPAFVDEIAYRPAVAAAAGSATFKQYLANENQSAGSTTIAVSTFDIAAGDFVLCLVAGAYQNVSGVSLDGQSLTRLGGVGSYAGYVTDLWYLANASADCLCKSDRFLSVSRRSVAPAM